jgi:hypothetical protein
LPFESKKKFAQHEIPQPPSTMDSAIDLDEFKLDSDDDVIIVDTEDAAEKNLLNFLDAAADAARTNPLDGRKAPRARKAGKVRSPDTVRGGRGRARVERPRNAPLQILDPQAEEKFLQGLQLVQVAKPEEPVKDESDHEFSPECSDDDE